MQWLPILSGMNPKSKVVLFKMIDGTYELAYRSYSSFGRDKFFTKDGKNILDYGVLLECWMDIENYDQPERLSEKTPEGDATV